jgi:hypothetical protein
MIRIPSAAWLLCGSLCIVVGLSACAVTGVPARHVEVVLSGANEVPPNTSTAAGKGNFWVHTDRTLNGVVETSGLEGTAAAFYLSAPGAVGPVVLQLVRTSIEGPFSMEVIPVSGASWSVPLSARFDEEQYSAFLAGEIYVNVHSARYPLGEIRGQLKP